MPLQLNAWQNKRLNGADKQGVLSVPICSVDKLSNKMNSHCRGPPFGERLNAAARHASCRRKEAAHSWLSCASIKAYWNVAKEFNYMKHRSYSTNQCKISCIVVYLPYSKGVSAYAYCIHYGQLGHLQSMVLFIIHNMTSQPRSRVSHVVMFITTVCLYLYELWII